MRLLTLLVTLVVLGMAIPSLVYATEADTSSNHSDLQFRWQLVPRLFDQLSLKIPAGISFKSVRQEGAKIILVGYALSNSRIAEFIQNLERSAFFMQPNITEIKSTKSGERQVSEFILGISLKPNLATDQCHVMPRLLPRDANVEELLVDLNQGEFNSQVQHLT